MKIGFLGIGAMGLSHLRAIATHCAGRAEATAIWASSGAHLSEAIEIAPGVQVFKNEKQLIESEVDAVFVSTPNFTHVPLALEVLAAGKHLFLEKPVGITTEECRRLAQACAATDRVVMIGHELRYSPYFQEIKRLLDSGAIGTPRMVWCREMRGPFKKKSSDWIEDARRSGGALVDKNCHHFDLMNWWVGARPARVCAFGGNAVNRVIGGEHQVLDHATVSFEYDSGVRGSLQLCMFAPELQEDGLEMGIVGDAGLMQTRLSALEILLWNRNEKSSDPSVIRVQAKRGEGWGGHLGFTEIHTAFLDAIQERKPPITTVADCVDGTLLAIAAERSIRTENVERVG